MNSRAVPRAARKPLRLQPALGLGPVLLEQRNRVLDDQAILTQVVAER